MKVELDANGLMEITAESEIETYALGKWFKDVQEMADAGKVDGCFEITPYPKLPPL